MNRTEIKNLKEAEEIVWGPFLGEIGWELMRWCGFIRNYKKQNPTKKVIVMTRSSRIDLYYNDVDDILPITIDDDYTTVRPNMYRADFIDPMVPVKLKSIIKHLYPNAYLFEPPKGKDSSNRNYFPADQMDFNFKPQEKNKEIIENILLKNKGKIPIVLSPRHRVDMNDIKTNRNWVKLYWYRLFDILKNSGKYIVFTVGVSPTFVDPPEDSCFEILEKYNDLNNNISQIGLTIEAIKHSKLTVGNQSSIPILSNLLKTPTIIWGHENHRHSVLENPYKTPCTFFDEKPGIYKTPPNKIFEEVERLC